tara:strand:+ start:930 stop:1553 length:624 start_codon:yes stop_codon:yes gene_type:complete
MSKTTIPTAGLADAAVTTAKITDANITTAKIANDAVENTKLDLTANYAFSGTISGAGGGKLLQTQSALFTNSSAHNSQTFSASNYTDQITPSATNSKIFVQFNFRSHVYQSSGTQAVSRLAIYRQINGGGYSEFFPANAGTCWGISVSNGEREFYGSPQISFLDTTHNTTTAIDYKLYARRSTSASGSVNVGGSSHQAQVILMEIGA